MPAKRLTTEEAIVICHKVHKGEYSYDPLTFGYQTYKSKITYYCKKHGKQQSPYYSHKRGKRCPSCATEDRFKKYGHPRSVSWDECLARFQKKHKGYYSYPNSEKNYKGMNEKIPIFCPDCDKEFWQTPNGHLRGGCQDCGYIKSGATKTHSPEHFEDKANSIHNHKYSYTGDYIADRSPVAVVCPTHGEFTQTANTHLNGCGCPKCGIQHSKTEAEILSFISSIYDKEILSRDRKALEGLEIDIFIPEKSLGIEVNGVYFHSTMGPVKGDESLKARNYYFSKKHKKKTDIAEEKGIRLIQIWDIEWEEKKQVFQMLIKSALGTLPKIGARTCSVYSPTTKEVSSFLEKSHPQGRGSNNKIAYMLKDANGRQVACMTFKEHPNNVFEISRYATRHAQVLGGSSKLLSLFLKEHQPSQVISYCDRRLFTGKSYEALGFQKESVSVDYSYLYQKKIYHRLFGSKSNLEKLFPKTFNSSKTELENSFANNVHRLHGCGNTKYLLNPNDFLKLV